MEMSILEHKRELVAELVLEESIYNQVCFHSQQAGEKALKALVVPEVMSLRGNEMTEAIP